MESIDKLTYQQRLNYLSQQKRIAEREVTGHIPNLTKVIDGVTYTEQWKDINGYDGVYQISDFGRVKSFFAPINKVHGRLKKPLFTAKGYQYIGLSKNNISKNHYIHRLVAIHFIPNPENKPEVNHKNSIRSDYRIENLEWTTKSENELHKNKNGGIAGTKHPSARLTEDNVCYIRSSKETAKILSEKLDVTTTTIYEIRKFKTWKQSLTK